MANGKKTKAQEEAEAAAKQGKSGGGYSPELLTELEKAQSLGLLDLGQLQQQQSDVESTLFGEDSDLLSFRLRFTPAHEQEFTQPAAISAPTEIGAPAPQAPGMLIQDIVADFFTMAPDRRRRLQEGMYAAGLYPDSFYARGSRKKPLELPAWGQADETTFLVFMKSLLGVARKQWAKDQVTKRKSVPAAVSAQRVLAGGKTEEEFTTGFEAAK